MLLLVVVWSTASEVFVPSLTSSCTVSGFWFQYSFFLLLVVVRRNTIEEFNTEYKRVFTSVFNPGN